MQDLLILLSLFTGLCVWKSWTEVHWATGTCYAPVVVFQMSHLTCRELSVRAPSLLPLETVFKHCYRLNSISGAVALLFRFLTDFYFPFSFFLLEILDWNFFLLFSHFSDCRLISCVQRLLSQYSTDLCPVCWNWSCRWPLQICRGDEVF